MSSMISRRAGKRPEVAEASRDYRGKAIRPEMTVRQLAVDCPAAVDVFRRYGERPRAGAAFGRLEPLEHFARRRGVSIGALLGELSAATGWPVETRSRYAERVHRGFLLSALFITLSLGAGWGAWLLLRIGSAGAFDAVSAAHVMAHGEAQLWGFIALFVIGVSLRTVLQGVARHRLGPWTCRSLLVLAWLGIGGSLCWSLFPNVIPWWVGVASAAALLAMSVGYWAMQLGMLRAKWRAPWARAVMFSGMWLTAWAMVTLVTRIAAGSAGASAYSDTQRLLLIELAVFGFAMNAIYGFGQMLLPGLLRIGATRVWAIESSQWLHNVGTLVLCLATGLAGHGWWSPAGSLMIAVGAMLYVVGLRGLVGRRRTSWRPEQGPAVSDYFMPLAFFWLIVGLALMTGAHVVETATGKSLPHAYMGAVRHALTVGFMTTLIAGVAQRLLPVLDRTVLALPRLSVAILVLLGVGNLLRVGSELAILGSSTAFGWMPLSGALEWCALALLSMVAVATMYRSDMMLSRWHVSRRSSLAIVLADHPQIEDQLLARGSGYLARTRSVPGELTVGSFAESEGWDAEQTVRWINHWLSQGTERS